jgi:hypothetical protein
VEIAWKNGAGLQTTGLFLPLNAVSRRYFPISWRCSFKTYAIYGSLFPGPRHEKEKKLGKLGPQFFFWSEKVLQKFDCCFGVAPYNQKFGFFQRHAPRGARRPKEKKIIVQTKKLGSLSSRRVAAAGFGPRPRVGGQGPRAKPFRRGVFCPAKMAKAGERTPACAALRRRASQRVGKAKERR